MTDQLFAADIAQESSGLKSKANYEQFAKQVSDILYEGQGRYNIPAFYKELFKGLGKDNFSSDDVKKVLDACTVIYNAKVTEEKKRDGGNKKGKQKPKISAGKATAALDNARNNNPAMVQDLMGDDDDDYYGEAYGEEDDVTTGKKRVPEADYDFM